MSKAQPLLIPTPLSTAQPSGLDVSVQVRFFFVVLSFFSSKYIYKESATGLNGCWTPQNNPLASLHCEERRGGDVGEGLNSPEEP